MDVQSHTQQPIRDALELLWRWACKEDFTSFVGRRHRGDLWEIVSQRRRLIASGHVDFRLTLKITPGRPANTLTLLSVKRNELLVATLDPNVFFSLDVVAVPEIQLIRAKTPAVAVVSEVALPEWLPYRPSKNKIEWIVNTGRRTWIPRFHGTAPC